MSCVTLMTWSDLSQSKAKRSPTEPLRRPFCCALLPHWYEHTPTQPLLQTPSDEPGRSLGTQAQQLQTDLQRATVLTQC
jgi:hypothetical protein